MKPYKYTNNPKNQVVEVRNIRAYSTDGRLLAQCESGKAHMSVDGRLCRTCKYYETKPYEPCARCLWNGRRTRWKAKTEAPRK